MWPCPAQIQRSLDKNGRDIIFFVLGVKNGTGLISLPSQLSLVSASELIYIVDASFTVAVLIRALMIDWLCPLFGYSAWLNKGVDLTLVFNCMVKGFLDYRNRHLVVILRFM